MAPGDWSFSKQHGLILVRPLPFCVDYCPCIHKTGDRGLPGDKEQSPWFSERQFTGAGRSAEQAAVGKNLRVLLVEDEVALRQLALKVLSNHGYRVTCAENGEEAWQTLQAEEFDLLVTDIQMPKMTGNELVKKVLCSRPELPVLMMSGYNPEGQVPDEVLFLPKPFTPQQLVEKVAALHTP